MLKLLLRLVRPGSPPRARRPVRPTAATSDVLARRTSPIPPSRGKTGTGVEFDPYNTGAFDRAASWERIGKRDY
jgi:hypothetical protein